MIPAKTLVEAYKNAIFPMAENRTGKTQWYTADPRGIIDFDHIHYSRKLLREIKQKNFEIRINSAFDQVIAGCARRSETWISKEIQVSYINFHMLGYAHSVETWSLDNRLIGGLYGVALPHTGVFFGESMFHYKTNASKFALHALIERLLKKKFVLLDIQMVTPLTKQFGASEIRLSDYKKRLRHAMSVNCAFVE